jgi:hypothetical protein
MPSFFTVSSAARSTSVAGGVHPRRDVANAQAGDVGGGIERQLAGNAGHVAGSGPLMACSTSRVSSTERAIGPSLSQLQLSVIAPVRGTRPKVGRRPVTPQRIDGLTMLPCVSLPMAKPTSPAATAAPGPALEPDEPSSKQPGIHGLSAKPDVVQRQRAQAELGNQHRASIVQPRSHRGIFAGNAIAIWLGAVGRRNAGRIEQVFRAPGNAMQRSAIFCRLRSPCPRRAPAQARARASSVMTQCSFGSNVSSRLR